MYIAIFYCYYSTLCQVSYRAMRSTNKHVRLIVAVIVSGDTRIWQVEILPTKSKPRDAATIHSSGGATSSTDTAANRNRTATRTAAVANPNKAATCTTTTGYNETATRSTAA